MSSGLPAKLFTKPSRAPLAERGRMASARPMRLSRGSTISLCVLLAVDKAIAADPVNDFALKEARRSRIPPTMCTPPHFKIGLMSFFAQSGHAGRVQRRLLLGVKQTLLTR